MKIGYFIACGLFVASVSVSAQEHTAVQEMQQDCDKNQLTMNSCASQRYASADQALNQQYTHTMQLQQDAAARQRLRDAQRAWVVFRDKNCLASVGPREVSGSIWPLLHYSCLERHSQRRIEDLKLQACGMQGCAP